MDFKIFFSSIDESIYSDVHGYNTFLKNIKINGERMPDYKGADIAFIGLTEERGTEENKGASQGADEIRKKLYRLKKGSGSYKIIDLGNLRPGHDLQETYLRIKEVCEALLDFNVLPVLIGGTHDLDYGQYMAYERMEKLISVLSVDAFLDMSEGEEASMCQRHNHHILIHEPNFLFNFSQLGYQSYLNDQYQITTLEKLYFETYRVGHLRNNIKEMEPVIRDADMLSFDISAIRSGDAPGNSNAQPFGLSGEDACQICWYAGLNEKLSSAGFYEYNPTQDGERKKTASVVATMVWYFIEGFYHRKQESDFKGNDYLKYVVSMPSDPSAIVFYKSKVSEKWWLEVNYPSGKEKYSRNCIVPCSYSDYETAIKGELPERWISTQAKLI